MNPPWCVLRLSLFPDDFAVETATAAERRHFFAAIEGTASNPALTGQLRDGELARVRARYEARARSRSVPRGLFAAATMGTPDGGAASRSDVRVTIDHRRSSLAVSEPLVLASSSVFHAGGVTLYRRSAESGRWTEVQLGVPEHACRVLLRDRRGTEAQWVARLAVETGQPTGQAERLVQALVRVGLLVHPGRISSWTHEPSADDPRALTRVGLDEAIELLHHASSSVAPGTFCTFDRPVRMPAALRHAQAVGELLIRCSRPAPPVVQRTLCSIHDGRWFPMVELERMAAGLVRRASGARPSPSPPQQRFVDWLRHRAHHEEVDLATAPVPSATGWHGTVMLGTRWTEHDQLTGVTLLSGDPCEVVARYDLTGLIDRVSSLDPRELVVLAYRGPGASDDVAAIRAHGTTTLEYCGWASTRERTLRLEDIEVRASPTRLFLRTRGDRRPLRLARALPFNNDLVGLHPLVELLSMVAEAEQPCQSLMDDAFEDCPVHPRVTWCGHVIRARSAEVPRELDDDDFHDWLRHTRLDGALNVTTRQGSLPLDPTDPAAVRELLRGAQTQRHRLVERGGAVGLEVDGRPHSAHALVPITIAPASAPPPLGIAGPADDRAPRGPFRTLHVRALAERMPSVLTQLYPRVQGHPFFYLFLSDELDSELRLRVLAEDSERVGSLIEELDDLLDRFVVRSWSLGPYLREWDRYGGAHDIEAVEAFFVMESQALCELCGELSLRSEARTWAHVLLIVQTLRLAGLEPEEQEALCRSAFESSCRELGWSSARRRALGEQWRTQRHPIMALARGGGGEPAALERALEQRHVMSQRWIHTHGKERLRRHLSSLIHLGGTRLHLRENRRMEGLACFFAGKLLGRWRHRPEEAAQVAAWLR